MNIKQFCQNIGITEAQFKGEEKIGDSLDLGSLTSIPDGFNPTVGGSLYLGSLTSIPDGFNPTVGCSLYLGSLTSDYTKLNNAIISWQNGKYIKADGIFTEVLGKKGRTYTVRGLNSEKVYYLVTDGKGTHAHGDSIEKAKEDLRFKKIAEKLKAEPIKEDTVITIQYYRIITGACEAGVRNWIDKTFEGDKKARILDKGIKAKDLLKFLKEDNAYGYERFKSLITF